MTDLQTLPNVGIDDAEVLRQVGADEAAQRLEEAGVRRTTHG
jgi:hypothetical protein